MLKEFNCSVVGKLTDMHKELKGFCDIVGSDSDAYMTFTMDRHGHMSVYGQIGGSHEDHFMNNLEGQGISFD
ncbi:MAG: hypothetical protein GX319_05005 [Clostridiales bacterium]|jgi:hypothetical protein|nr:hypothetical protein [Clostridiales bacterium]